MRAPTSDLPLVLDDVSLGAGGTRLIDNVPVVLTADPDRRNRERDFRGAADH